MRRVVTVPAHQIKVGDKILPPQTDSGPSISFEEKEVLEAYWDHDHDYYLRWEPMTADDKYVDGGSSFMESSTFVRLILPS